MNTAVEQKSEREMEERHIHGPPAGNRTAELALVLFFLFLVAAVPLLQTGVELKMKGRVRALEVFAEKPTSKNLRAYEENLEDASVVARALRPLFQFAQLGLLRDGGEKAVLGRDGWLFYRPGLQAALSRPSARDSGPRDAAEAIVAWRDALARRGIHLLVVIAPNKESIYPDYVSGRVSRTTPIVALPTRELMERLDAAGVCQVNLFGVFGEARTTAAGTDTAPLYLKTDSHWSPFGVSLAAKAVAERLVQLGWTSRGSIDWVTRTAAVDRMGDVPRMLQLPRIERLVPPELVQCVQVRHPISGEPYSDASDAGILVIGDSFLRIYQQDEPTASGFIAHLAKELRQPLTSLVSDGGASTLVRQELYRRAGLLEGKKVVIWEFVERDIRLGTEGWQQVPLP